MKFIALSDTHGQHCSKKLNKFLQENPADVLLFAGDYQRNHFDNGIDFIDWLHELPFKYKVMTFGNHDGNWEYAVNRTRVYNDIIVLNNDSAIIEGIKIWGSPYSLIFMDWWFMKSDKELEEIYKYIPNDINILMTHTPAFGILDMTKDGILTGSMSLLNRIKELKKLKYHVGAHIHENGGKCENAYGIKFINTSILNEKYQLVNNPILFEF
jgi:Icc-related predicted phosphoesterase